LLLHVDKLAKKYYNGSNFQEGGAVFMAHIDENIIENEKVNKKLLIALTVIYIRLLIWVIVFKCNYNEGLHIETNRSMTLLERLEYKKVPFEKFIEAVKDGGILALVEIVALFFNVICFLPFGGFLRFFTKKKWLIVVYSALFSLGVEVFQLFSCWGGPDYIDIISNTLGALFGIFIYDFVRPKISDEAINKMAKWAVGIFTPVAIFAIINSIINFPG
jgi:glycopeptide antibiotics resistance protein